MKAHVKARLLREGGPWVVNTKVGTNDPDQDTSLYIGRTTPWGNPYYPKGVTAGKGMPENERERVVEAYIKRMMNMESGARITWLLPVVEAMSDGRMLRCFCAPLLCHGHALAAWICGHPEFQKIRDEYGIPTTGKPA